MISDEDDLDLEAMATSTTNSTKILFPCCRTSWMTMATTMRGCQILFAMEGDSSMSNGEKSPGLAAVLRWLDEREEQRLASLRVGADPTILGYPGWAAKMLRSFFASKEEIALPFVLAYRACRKQFPVWVAWGLMDTWRPCKVYRRAKMSVRVWLDRRYKGTDEFHRSLNMDVLSMLEMTSAEREVYLDDLMRRRERLHDRSVRSH
jgi:hypothetical protein